MCLPALSKQLGFHSSSLAPPQSGPSEETFSNPLSVFGRICWPECLVSLAQLDNDNILSWVVSGGGGWWPHSRPCFKRKQSLSWSE